MGHGLHSTPAGLFLLVCSCFSPRRAGAQTNAAPAPGMGPYGLSVSVDEVDLTFHAADAHGLPVNDLKLEELSLLDNGQPPAKILAFESLQDLPIRAGILLDTSASMDEHRGGDRAIAIKYAQRLLRQQTDRAFVMGFGYLAEVPQPWTGIRGTDRGYPQSSNGRATGGRHSDLHRDLPGLSEPVWQNRSRRHGNFILLFSDGEDNASHAYLEQAVDICQHSNTAIYAFRAIEIRPFLRPENIGGAGREDRRARLLRRRL